MFSDKWTRPLTALIAALIFAGQATPACAQPIQQRAARTEAKQIPFEMFRNALPLVQARINGSAPMWFLLDTCSTYSFLDTAAAANLGIKTAGAQTITGSGGGQLNLTFAEGLTVEVAEVKLSNQPFAVMPWRNRYDRNVVGMLGTPFLRRFVVEIDYQAQRLTMREPQSYAYTGSGSIIPLEFPEETPAAKLSVTIGARAPLEVKLCVDTGASQTLILNPDFVEKHQLLASTEGMLKMDAGSLAGRVNYFKSRAREVKLGRFALPDMLTDLSVPGGAKNRLGLNGVVGNALLKRFKVILDYERSRMILEPSELFGVPADYDWTGMWIVAEGKTYKLSQVFDGSQAGRAGLQAGDIILAVDERPTAQMSLNELRKIFKQDGSAHVLDIQRGTEKMQQKLQTARIQ
jgi:hypothetical protein